MTLRFHDVPQPHPPKPPPATDVYGRTDAEYRALPWWRRFLEYGLAF